MPPRINFSKQRGNANSWGTCASGGFIVVSSTGVLIVHVRNLWPGRMQTQILLSSVERLLGAVEVYGVDWVGSFTWLHTHESVICRDVQDQHAA